MWGLGVIFRGIFIVNIKRIAGKLRTIILLHLGLVTLRFHYWKTLKTLICMISGFSDVSMTPQTNILSLETTGYFNNSKKNPNSLLKYILFLNITLLRNRKV